MSTQTLYGPFQQPLLAVAKNKLISINFTYDIYYLFRSFVMSTDHLLWHQGEYTISTRKESLDIDAIQQFLTRSYWASGISRSVIEKSIQHSLPFGVYQGNRQVGFARIITDYATFAYIADVFILEEFRGKGLGKWLMQTIAEHPDLQGFRRWLLMTRDAHGLYEHIGFTPSKTPERIMERIVPNIYQRDMPRKES